MDSHGCNQVASGYRADFSRVGLRTVKSSGPEVVQMRMVINKRFRLDDRRQNYVMLSFPTRDRNGSTIKECRRRIPDRRIANILVKWIDEA